MIDHFQPRERLSIREKAARRDGGIGNLGTPGVFLTVKNWNWRSERVIARKARKGVK